MFIVAASLRTALPRSAMCCAATTLGSAGAVMNFLGRGYKHRVPPGPKQCLSNTLFALYQNTKLIGSEQIEVL